MVLAELSEGLVDELGAGDGEGEPEIELVVAGVVVGYAGQGVDSGDDLVELVERDFGGDEGADIAQVGGIEDSADAADDVVLLKLLDLLDDLGFGGAELLGELEERARLDGEVGLDEV